MSTTRTPLLIISLSWTQYGYKMLKGGNGMESKKWVESKKLRFDKNNIYLNINSLFYLT